MILEIRAGTGGEEAALFAMELLKMYTYYAQKKGWQMEVTGISETELGGCKECTCLISGKGAYSRFKFESGLPGATGAGNGIGRTYPHLCGDGGGTA